MTRLLCPRCQHVVAEARGVVEVDPAARVHCRRCGEWQEVDLDAPGEVRCPGAHPRFRGQPCGALLAVGPAPLRLFCAYCRTWLTPRHLWQRYTAEREIADARAARRVCTLDTAAGAPLP